MDAIDPRAAILVVVDMQAIFDPAAGGAWPVPGFAPCLAAAERLRAAWAAAGALALRTRYVRPADGPRRLLEYGVASAAPSDPDAPDYALVGAGTRGNETVVTCDRFGKWGALAPHVGADAHVVLCGVATECCVLATALAAVDAGAHVTVVANAVAGCGTHEAALTVLAAYDNVDVV